jgi:hypothetical protein
MKPKHPPGPPMDLGNMRQLGVQNLVASCLNDACRHVALIDVSKYPEDTEVPWFRSRYGQESGPRPSGPVTRITLLSSHPSQDDGSRGGLSLSVGTGFAGHSASVTTSAPRKRRGCFTGGLGCALFSRY